MKIGEAPVPEIYLHAANGGWNLGTLLVRFERTVPRPDAVVAALREIEPLLVVRNTRTMQEVVDEALGTLASSRDCSAPSPRSPWCSR